MCNAVRALGLALWFAVVSSATGYAQSDEYPYWDQNGPSGPVEPFGPGYEVVSYDENSGHLTLKFTITYFPDAYLKATCEVLMMTMYPFDGLIYAGPDTLLVPYRTQNPYSTVWELTLLPNDTSYLVFREECDRTAYHYGITFVTTGDTLITRWGTGGRDGELVLEWTVRRWPDPREDLERAKREWEAQQESLKHFKGKETTGPVMNPEDSALVDSLSDQGKRQLGKMRIMENSPLTDYERQTIEIEGRWFVRDRGETKFRRVEAKTDEQLRADAQRYWDSLGANPPKNAYDLILDLRDRGNYEFAKSLLDSLIAADSAGFFRAVMDRPTLIKLIDKGIKYHRTNKPPLVPSDSTKLHRTRGPEPEKKPESSLPLREGQDVLFFEGFESVWPGQWYVGDGDPGNGYDYWGDLYDWYVVSGWWSGWCADEGDMPEGEHYDDYIWAFMEMTVPVDLTQHENTELTFWILYDTELGYDYCAVYGSTDGFAWVLIQPQFTGYSGGWDEITVPIQSGGDYYVWFLFESDYLYSSDYGGVYLDDIEVTGDPATQANLTWYWPPFWDWPIVE